MESNFYKTYFEVEKSHWWFQGRRSLIRWLLSVYVKDKNDFNILDIGSGSGYLVGVLQKDGYEVSGVDASLEAIEFGTSKGIKNLSLASGDKLNFPDASFKCVLCLDTIEHIKDDSFAVREIERLLAPGGYGILTVPAYQWMWGVQDEVAHHYRRYSMKSFLNLLKSAKNLKVVRKSYFNTFLFPVVAGVRLVGKWFKIEGRESDFDIHSNLINTLLLFIFRAEIWLLRVIGYPFGVSILLVLKKNEQSIQR
ncbi:MAG: class I SAM-dependent methyltransferase [Candidatus Pacebacteria bacterium]|nr:class I SAM-dependent methyltransferase [Candidatus Paceibacterota bacterium]